MAKRASRVPKWLRTAGVRVASIAILVLTTYYVGCALLLLTYSVADPFVTGVQLQRRVESWFRDAPYQKKYAPLDSVQIPASLRHAVIASEDQRFFDHFGVDLGAIGDAVADNLERGRRWRGGSTITQQLVKNLFMTTHSSYVRKLCEQPLAILAEVLVSKERLLTLYLNVIEFGDGIYGVEAAARHYFGVSASALTVDQAARLAAVIPSPRRRSPSAMTERAAEIRRQMQNLGYR